jgi:pimeloyl-ACP methyl ester carboxylesterase
MNQREVWRAPAPTRFARRGFARLAYGTAGEGDRAVVLLHDLLADRTTLSQLRDDLAERGWRVVLPDLRGHGASAAISGIRYPVAELTLDLRAILEAEGVERISLVGVGLGATVGLDLALVEPARLDRLVLVDPLVPGILLDDPDPVVSAAAAGAREAALEIAELASKGSVDRAFDRYYGPRRGPNWRATEPKARLGAMRRHANAFGPLLTAAYGYRPAAAGPHPMPDAALILVAADSPELDRVAADRLRTVLDGARLESFGSPRSRDTRTFQFLDPDAGGRG